MWSGRLAGIPLRRVFGNHGIEPSPALPAARRAVQGWLARLTPRLDHVAGIIFDNKGASLAIHYRKARNRRAALKAILAATADLTDARVLKGLLVVDLLPVGAPNKATALQSELRRLRCRAALYLGDDQTDEDVFALSRRLPLLAVRVGRKSAQPRAVLPAQPEPRGYALGCVAGSAIETRLKLAISHRDTESAEAEESGKGWIQCSPNPSFLSDLCALCASVWNR